MLTIQPMPNLSMHMPNSSPHICFSSGTDTVPPSDELRPVAAQFVGVVAAEADRHVVAAVQLHPRRSVGAHEREPAVGLEHAVHDLVGLWRVLGAVFAERVQRQRAAEHVLVELHGLSGVVAEADVGIESRGHGMLLVVNRVGPRTLSRSDEVAVDVDHEVRRF